jgi:deoxyribodipyrimidine photolyase
MRDMLIYVAGDPVSQPRSILLWYRNDLRLHDHAPLYRATQGGETAGLAQVQDYIWTQDRLRVDKEIRNSPLGADYLQPVTVVH